MLAARISKSEKEKVLIIDDESYIREFVGQILSEHYKIFFASSGAEGIEIAKREKPSAIVLDVLMPLQNGIETCSILRKTESTSAIPVLMLTAANQVEMRIEAFDSGADDFISKPFLPNELLSRVRSKIKRSKEENKSSGKALKVSAFKVNFDEMRVFYKDQLLDLGLIEFKIFNCLLSSHGQIVDRQPLNQFVWGSEVPSERALDPHITSLRKKMKVTNAELKTVYGRGYSLVFKFESVS
jgi:two-component system, OmpR family, alkaline phosphatase synthesis response regulator PhoP